MAGAGVNITRPPVHRPTELPAFENDDDNSFIIAIIILVVVLFGIIVTVMIFSCFERWSIPACCHRLCPCRLKVRSEDIEMGYLPANITVNQGAVQQGVPDIFLRPSSQSGRISADPASFEISRDDGSVETSGAWADYLRRATMSGRRHRPLVGEAKDSVTSTSEGD